MKDFGFFFSVTKVVCSFGPYLYKGFGLLMLAAFLFSSLFTYNGNTLTVVNLSIIGGSSTVILLSPCTIYCVYLVGFESLSVPLEVTQPNGDELMDIQMCNVKICGKM